MTKQKKDSSDPTELINFLNSPYANQRTKLGKRESEALKLTPHQKSVLAGTLLGDGSLKQPNVGYANSRFQMKHSVKQLEWIKWKADQLANLASIKPFAHQLDRGPNMLDPTTGQKVKSTRMYDKLHFRTRALPCLTEFQEELLTDNVLDFSKPWLYKYVDELALMVWYLDDGGKQGKGNRDGKLATHGFALDQVELLRDFLSDKWGIHATIQTQTMEKKKRIIFCN